MKIIRNFHQVNSEIENSVLTMGNFDGVHLGHQKMLEQVRNIAAKNRTKSALLTFEPHPAKILNTSKPWEMRIFTLSQKLHFLKDNNLVDIVFIINFTKDIANLPAEDFAKQILINCLKIRHLAIGYDFAFGKNKSGDANFLEKLSQIYGFGFSKISAQKNSEENIYSSTNIRKSILSGDVKSAGQMLGRAYEVSGIVINGQKKGREIGFPTANIVPKYGIIKPKYGVYKAMVKLSGERYPAIVNFGIKPTLVNDQPLFEAHIFNFNQDIYGKKITIELLDFIRDEQKFASLEALKEQIKKDCASLMITN